MPSSVLNLDKTYFDCEDYTWEHGFTSVKYLEAQVIKVSVTTMVDSFQFLSVEPTNYIQEELEMKFYHKVNIRKNEISTIENLPEKVFNLRPEIAPIFSVDLGPSLKDITFSTSNKKLDDMNDFEYIKILENSELGIFFRNCSDYNILICLDNDIIRINNAVLYKSSYSQIKGTFNEYTLEYTFLGSGFIYLPKDDLIKKFLKENIKQDQQKFNSKIVVISTAEIKARQTLRDLITEREYRKYISFGHLFVRGKSNKVYQIFSNQDKIQVYDKGKPLKKLCIHTDRSCPPTDHVLNLKLMIELDEDLIWKESHVFDFLKKTVIEENSLTNKTMALYKKLSSDQNTFNIMKDKYFYAIK